MLRAQQRIFTVKKSSSQSRFTAHLMIFIPLHPGLDHHSSTISTIPTSSSSTASPESRRLTSLSRYLRSACLITASVEPGRDFSRLKAPTRILIRSFRPYGLTGIQAFSYIINYSGVKTRRTFKLGEVVRVLPRISRSSKREVASSISSY